MKTRSFKSITCRQFFSIILLFALNSTSAFASELVHQDSFSLQDHHSIKVDWWLPDGLPKGLVYLQHRFMGSSANLKSLGKKIADNGFIVMMPTLNVALGNPKLAQEIATTLNQQQFVIPHHLSIPSQWALVGHSAGGLNVLFIGDDLVSLGNEQLKVVINLDGVDVNNKMSSLISEIDGIGVPVESILSNPSMCNENNNAISALRDSRLKAGRVIQLTISSSHLDPEGTDDNHMMFMLCHKPTSENTLHYHQLTLAWLNEAFGYQVSPNSDLVIKQTVASGHGKELHLSD
ncbi:hypothetical protein D5018_11415 [Parashewanella curva]|uniref:Alpha/beta hydrolase n=1 Tax=Parashewanella curva TaxID=2338552 RepID=A0A3L8PW41_9GAMM|nr:hypothetical protein [Parashewanella curva]RLV59556.1 hypothetical protein D5018_11415 [Parashewanella curva]